MIAKVFFKLGRILSLIFHPSIKDMFLRCLNKISTGYKSSSFRTVGWPISIGKGTVISGGDAFCIGNGVSFGIANVLEAYYSYVHQKFNPLVKIGDNCTFGDYNHITCINGINIGQNLLTGRRVLITDNCHGYGIRTGIKMASCTQSQHPIDTDCYRGGYFVEYQLDTPPISRPLTSKGSVNIGNNVWIGDNACILGGVTIGNGVIIGANTVVNKDVPDYAIVVGAKQRIIIPNKMDN